MIHLDTLWDTSRSAKISGKTHRIPFSIKLPSRFSKFISVWLKNNGPDWTVERLKLLVLWAIQILSGNQEFKTPWFASTIYKGYRIPKLRLFKYLVDHRLDPNRIRLVLTLLKSYRLRTWGRPSLEPIVSTPRSTVPDSYIRYLRQYCKLPHVPSSVLEPVLVVNTRKAFAVDSGRTYPGPYGKKDSDFPAEIRFLYEDQNRDPFILGTLTTVEDKGKYRTILVGHWAIQLKTKRLADFLRSWLWEQPEIASGDQTKMSTFILTNLENGRYMMSIDLSNATDRLSRDFQIKLLASMGVPVSYFKFLELPAAYRFEEFEPEKGKGLGTVEYSNGQPMGLFVSFPMFELAHYVITKWAVAVTDATFSICGDDLVISCRKEDAPKIFERYRTLIERFGGVISVPKTVFSETLAEGVGALFLKGYPKELRIPSGKLSILEATSPGFWLNDQIRSETPLGRALAYSWLTTKERKEYSHRNRRALNEFMISTDLSDWHLEALRSLSSHQVYPMSWYTWEEEPEGVSGMVPRFPEDSDLPEEIPLSFKTEPKNHFRYISLEKYRDARVTSKIISLFKKKDRKQ